MSVKTIFDAKAKVWKSHYSAISQGLEAHNSNIGLGHLIMEIFKKNPDRITQVFADTGAEMTCYEMQVRTIKIASYLIKCGYKQNDIAGTIAMNSENITPVIFACLLLGMPINPLAPILLESDIVQMYSKTRPKVIFCDANTIEKVKNAIKTMRLDDCQIITFREKIAEHDFVDELLSNSKIKIDKIIYPELNNIADLPAFILCSSGSTGPPKAVCKSHRQMICHNMSRSSNSTGEQVVVFNYSPLFWIAGIKSIVSCSLNGAKCVLTSESYSTRGFIDIIQKFGVKMAFLSSSYFAAFVNDKSLPEEEKILKGIQLMACGGSSISIDLQESAKKYFPNAKIMVVYGKCTDSYQKFLTNLIRHSNSLSGCTEIDLVADTYLGTRRGSVGQLCGLTDAIIIDENGQKLGPNQIGEICFKTEAPFIGYLGDAEATKESFYDENYFKIGDIGYFDDDCFLYHIERKKEMLRAYNFQIIPSELEDLINSLDGVDKSSIVGVYDEKTGNDVICAFVIRTPGQDPKINEHDIHDHVNSKVIDAKKIRGGIYFVESFPLTPTGKVMKHELKKIAEKKLFSKLSKL